MVATQSNPVSIFVEIRLAVRKLSLEIIVVVVIRDAISTHQHHVLVMVAHIGLFGTTPIMQLSQTNMFFIEVQKEQNLQTSQDHII